MFDLMLGGEQEREFEVGLIFFGRKLKDFGAVLFEMGEFIGIERVKITDGCVDVQAIVLCLTRTAIRRDDPCIRISG